MNERETGNTLVPHWLADGLAGCACTTLCLSFFDFFYLRWVVLVAESGRYYLWSGRGEGRGVLVICRTTGNIRQTSVRTSSLLLLLLVVDYSEQRQRRRYVGRSSIVGWAQNSQQQTHTPGLTESELWADYSLKNEERREKWCNRWPLVSGNRQRLCHPPPDSRSIRILSWGRRRGGGVEECKVLTSLRQPICYSARCLLLHNKLVQRHWQISATATSSSSSPWLHC